MPAKGEANVPKGWKRVRLGDVARERNQRAHSAERIFSVTKHAGFVPSLEYFNRQVFSRNTSNYKVVHHGDLAYATIHLDEGSLGILLEAEIGAISPMYTVFEADVEQVEPKFLFATLKLPQMVSKYKRLGEGTVHRRKSISFERLSALSFAIPDVQEQRRVIAVLDSIDDAIEGAEAVIAATEQLRDSLLHDLLTRGLPGQHTEWRDVPGLGTIPADWEVVRLGEVAEVASGQVDPRDKQFQHQPFVAPDDIESHTGRLMNKRTVADAGAISGKYQFEMGDVLYSKIRPYLMKAYVPREPGLCSADIYPIRATAKLEPNFLAKIILSTSFTDYIRTCSDRTGIPKVNRVDLFKYALALPSLEEQRVIASTLEGVETAVEVAREELAGLRSLKRSTADALLTGRVRVWMYKDQWRTQERCYARTMLKEKSSSIRGFLT